MAIKLLSAGGGSVTLDVPSTAANVAINVPAGNATLITSNDQLSFRNRIINGDMRIDQRNNGAVVTIVNSDNRYLVDRFSVFESSSAVLTAQQDSVAPSGFNNSLKITVTTADASIAASDQAFVRQRIEGFNVADLGWGAAGAQPVTLSFWVRSSLTGTFGGALNNGATDRSYPFTYSIAAANTWEQKTITVDGDTTGTWLTTNGIGLQINWSLAAGSDTAGTAGAWAGAALRGVTGQVQVISTLNATWQITGVQLEAGAVATPFERRPFGAELALCQRYFQTIGRAPALADAGAPVVNHIIANPQRLSVPHLPITMRADPTVSCFNNVGTIDRLTEFSSGSSFTVSAVFGATNTGGGYIQLTSNVTNGISLRVSFTAEL